MKRIVDLLVLAAVFALVGCGGGGGTGTAVNATPPTLLSPGVGKEIRIYYGAWGDVYAHGSDMDYYPNVYSAVSIQGQQISFTDNTGRDIITTAPVTIRRL